MELIMQSISAIRNRRAEMNVPPSKKAKVIIVTDKTDVFKQGTAFFENLRLQVRQLFRRIRAVSAITQ